MFINGTTLRTGARGISGVYQLDQNPSEYSFILDKLLKLVKCPRVLLATLSFSNRHPGAYALQILQGYTSPGVFSFRHNTLTNHMVDIGGKPLLFLGTLFKQALGLFRAINLKARTKFGMAFPETIDLTTAICLTIGVRSYINNAQVNTKKLLCFMRRWLFNLTRLIKIKLPIAIDQVCFAKQALKQFKVMFAGHKRNMQPSSHSPNGYCLVSQTPGKNTAVIGDTPVIIEKPLSSAVKFIRIGHLRKHPNSYLSRQLKHRADLNIKHVVKVILTKGMCLPSTLANIVGRSICSFQCPLKSLSLPSGWIELYLRNKFHNGIIPYCQDLNKRKEVSVNSSPAKAGVSLTQFYEDSRDSSYSYSMHHRRITYWLAFGLW